MFKTSSANWNCADGGMSTGVGFCQTDNHGLTWHVESSLLGTPKHSSVAHQLNNEFNPTALIVTFTSNPSYSGGSETDIIYQRGTSGLFGGDAITWCNDAVSTLRCDQHYIRFRTTAYSQSLSCHESGHAVGLTHPGDANPPKPDNHASFYCMRVPAVDQGLGTDGTLTSQINATYS